MPLSYTSSNKHNSKPLTNFGFPPPVEALTGTVAQEVALCIDMRYLTPRISQSGPASVNSNPPDARRIPSQDAQARANEQQGLQDEGEGETGHAQAHQATLQQANDVLINRPQRPVRPSAKCYPKKLVPPSKKP